MTMIRGLVVGALLIAVALLTAREGYCADAEAGKAVYTKKCASCHGKEGEGNPTMAKMLKADIRPLSANEVQSKSDDQLRKDIVEGTGKMKAVTGLADADVANLVAYVRSLAK